MDKFMYSKNDNFSKTLKTVLLTELFPTHILFKK